MTERISHHDALIWVMVCVAASDGDMTDGELHAIGEIVKTLPVFRGYDVNRLPDSARACGAMLHAPKGLEEVMRMIGLGLPAELHDTAYALACELAAVDSKLDLTEARLLQLVRAGLKVDRLTTVAIERAVQARYRRA
ncbi:tellurite resistance TerB family protein [Zavarzinia compransoris]|uniref:Tellurite resistance protein TerB n=1 Tax=Zavarzinia compransoris TaxID=1264899 RepID=A0A317DTQ6_9PROT|nr:tellurite resistance TerB family protein [Zavarzinia compransoris]PWR17752.1 Tellurite resistance protein TerB [Zavarzinia compransoris]TDP49277.1 tellurite resistance protein TerB [Zavarzinia compransoris]